MAGKPLGCVPTTWRGVPHGWGIHELLYEDKTRSLGIDIDQSESVWKNGSVFCCWCCCCLYLVSRGFRASYVNFAHRL